MDNYFYYLLYALMLAFSCWGIYLVTLRNNLRSKERYFRLPEFLPPSSAKSGTYFLFKGNWSSLRFIGSCTAIYSCGLIGLIYLDGISTPNLLFLYGFPYLLLELFKTAFALLSRVTITGNEIRFSHLIRTPKIIDLSTTRAVAVLWTHYKSARFFNFYPTFIFTNDEGYRSIKLPGRHFPDEVTKILSVLLLLHPGIKYTMKWDQYGQGTPTKSGIDQDFMELNPAAQPVPDLKS